MSTTHVMPRRFSDVVTAGDANPRRWLVLAVICSAALMIVLDVTVMNLALPSAQRALGFTNADRQWIVTAYALSFGSLLLFCGRLADLIGRKVTFLAGLAGFAAASAVGGASDSFTMLVTPTGFVLEVEEAWDSGGEHWTCRELFRADIGDEGITQLSVCCTGDWDAARRAGCCAGPCIPAACAGMSRTRTRQSTGCSDASVTV